jgi:hypothetical protein
MQKYFAISKKSCIFAPAFENEPIDQMTKWSNK